MKTLNQETGVTFLGFIWTVIILLLVVFLLLKLVPPYLNNQKLQHALQELAVATDVNILQRNAMISRLDKSLHIDSARDIIDLKQALKVKRLNSAEQELSIDYEIVVPIAYNINFLFFFENHVVAPSRSDPGGFE